MLAGAVSRHTLKMYHITIIFPTDGFIIINEKLIFVFAHMRKKFVHFSLLTLLFQFIHFMSYSDVSCFKDKVDSDQLAPEKLSDQYPPCFCSTYKTPAKNI